VSPTTPSLATQYHKYYHTGPTPGLSPLHAQTLARGPLAAVRLHRAACSGTARAAVRAGGGDDANAGAHQQPHAGSQDNGNGKLLLPQLDRLHLAFKRSQASPSASSSSQDQQVQQAPKSVIPTHHRVTDDDRSFIVLTETKFSFRCIPVWDLYSPHRTRVEKKHM
jgi:hypothetical protein